MLRDINNSSSCRKVLASKLYNGYRVLYNSEVPSTLLDAMLHAFETVILHGNDAPLPPILRIELQVHEGTDNNDEKVRTWFIIVVFEGMTKVWEYYPGENW